MFECDISMCYIFSIFIRGRGWGGGGGGGVCQSCMECGEHCPGMTNTLFRVSRSTEHEWSGGVGWQNINTILANTVLIALDTANTVQGHGRLWQAIWKCVAYTGTWSIFHYLLGAYMYIIKLAILISSLGGLSFYILYYKGGGALQTTATDCHHTS